MNRMSNLPPGVEEHMDPGNEPERQNGGCSLSRESAGSQSAIFSGDDSRELWDAINQLRGVDLWDLMYSLGCKLQELESRVRRIENV